MASSTFSGPVTSTAGFVGDVTTGTYTVATLPDATVNTGMVLFVSDAATNATLGYSDGTIWRRADTGAVVS